MKIIWIKLLSFQIYGEISLNWYTTQELNLFMKKTKPLESGYLVYSVGKQANDDRVERKDLLLLLIEQREELNLLKGF